MNTQESREIVQQFYESLGKGDIQTALSLLSEDVEWIIPFPREIISHGGTWYGKNGVEQFLSLLNQNLEFQQSELKDFIAQNNKVAVVGNYQLMAKKTGKVYELNNVMIWTIENGKLKQFREYADTAVAVAAFLGN